jgi:hypothetical protein
MSSASPGAERAALAILFRRRRSASQAMANTCERIVVRVARSASAAAGTGKSNSRSTRRPVFALKGSGHIGWVHRIIILGVKHSEVFADSLADDVVFQADNPRFLVDTLICQLKPGALRWRGQERNAPAEQHWDDANVDAVHQPGIEQAPE